MAGWEPAERMFLAGIEMPELTASSPHDTETIAILHIDSGAGGCAVAGSPGVRVPKAENMAEFMTQQSGVGGLQQNA